MTVQAAERFRFGGGKLRNLVLLVLGYGMGQGSTFLAQTWLMATSQLSVLALFGTHISYALLCTTIVDAGGTTTLARHAAKVYDPLSDEDDLWQTYWEMCVIRLGVAAILALLSAVTILAFDVSSFTIEYASFGATALLIWAFNFAGILDGLRLSGFNGIANALPFILSSTLLVLTLLIGVDHVGMMTGGALSLGFLLSVLLQLRVLTGVGHPVKFRRPTAHGVKHKLRDSLALLGSILPGQLYFRLQIHLCNVYLGPEATAVFIYVKQIFVAVAQVVGFIRRVEFSELVSNLSRVDKGLTKAIIKSQKLGSAASVAFAVLVMSGATVALALNLHQFRESGVLILVFAPCLITNAIALALYQGLAALGQFHRMFVVASAATALGAASSFVLVHSWGASGLLLADIIVDVVGISLIALLLVQRNFRRTT